MNNPNLTKVLLGIGILASVLVGIGEYLLHFLPGGPGGEIDMLLHVPLARASIGHFFVVFGAPLYFAGYLGLYNLFKSQSVRLATMILILGLLAFSVGGIWVSSRYMAAHVLQNTAGTELYDGMFAAYEQHYQILVWFLRIVVALISICYVILILKNSLNLSKWIALANPVLLLVIVISSLFWFNPLGVHIAPIAMNVTHFFFFGILLFSLNKH